MRRLMIALLAVLSVTQPAHAQTMGSGIYDDRSPTIAYDGVWTDFSDANAYNGSRKISSEANATGTISFSIWGDGLVIYQNVGPNRGNYNLCINAVCQSMSQYNASFIFNSVSVTGLGYGAHSIVIAKTSPTLSLSFDAFLVLPPAPAPTVLPPTPIVVVTVVMPELTLELQPPDYQNSWQIDDQTVAFDYRIDVGQSVTIALLSVLVVGIFVVLFAIYRGQ